MFALIAYLLLALGVSFLCSILEASLLSMPPSFVRQQERNGTRTGKLLGRVKREIDQSLAAILTLNTVAHTVGAAGVGSQAARVFGEAYFGVISAVLTLLILIISEIIPKTLGAQFWRGLAPFTAHSCRLIVISTYPLVALSKQITQLIQTSAKREKSVSREELIALAQIGRIEGVLDESESRMIRSLIRFREARVEDIMTPRTVMSSLDENLTCEAAISDHTALQFSRIPVYSESKDSPTGYVVKSEILQKVAKGGGDELLKIKELRRPIRIVSALDSLGKFFHEFISYQEQIAVVADEYGGTSGLVTMEDLVETLIGLEIVDESDSVVDMRELARKRWNKQIEFENTDESDERS
ncbi:CNNM domain-containing protein [Pelagicoccus sp. SDUM812003]|uniref:CNNM domain-containing protein n=1 Tax=Pelagicoccus sp. SDUM812003 TaxID=3041267 RepID=UPI0028102318|nr:CNNM domain-containing protein [Pelagicoccus sp. SDUM812003]MDQ8204615.1 CNNM domain-containing protein [Pelagicoccus sp. SDUM812003]